MRRKPPEFTSRLSRGETIAALAYLPVHILLLPLALTLAAPYLGLGEADLNLALYAVGTVYMLLLLLRFLRRDFDPLLDRPGYCVVEIITNYALMYLGNLVVTLIFMFIPLFSQENPNNSAIMDLAGQDWGKMTAMAVFLAPIMEECMFRAGIFGTLRRYNRWAAYVVATLAFSLYHVYGYAVIDSIYWLYLIQYLPVSILLCRVYERTNSIWCSIFFHMLVNWVSMNALKMLEALL